MANIIGVRFQSEGKVYFYDPGEQDPALGDYVVAESPRGIDIGEVVNRMRDLENDEQFGQVKQIIRIANAQDLARAQSNREAEKNAYGICQKKIQEHRLDMKLVSVEYTFDNSKILFYFTSNGRVDFRSLVKDLAGVFKTRIELRQIGVRDEAKMIGGLGPCGRQICCGAFLNEFQPVSIKMAKEQNLSLNPTKISGVCGRLMCCLKYEQDNYETIRKMMPRVGKEVNTPDGPGIVTELNIIKETITVRITKGDSSELKELRLDEINKPGVNVTTDTGYADRTQDETAPGSETETRENQLPESVSDETAKDQTESARSSEVPSDDHGKETDAEGPEVATAVSDEVAGKDGIQESTKDHEDEPSVHRDDRKPRNSGRYQPRKFQQQGNRYHRGPNTSTPNNHHPNEKTGAAVNESTDATEKKQHSDHIAKLGKPVQRENPNRRKQQRDRQEVRTAQPGKDAAGKEHRESNQQHFRQTNNKPAPDAAKVQTPAAGKPTPTQAAKPAAQSSNWQDALKKAMADAEGKK